MRSTFLQKNCPAIVYGHRRICTLMQCDYCSYSIAQVHTKHTNTYIQISILRKTNTSTCSHIQLHSHTCMHVRASKTYTCIYTHIMIVTPEVQKIYPTIHILATCISLNLVCLGHLLCTKYRANTHTR